jgi:hypothetical protein
LTLLNIVDTISLINKTKGKSEMRKATIKELKRDFELGYLKSYRIMKAGITIKIWNVQFMDVGNNPFNLVDARTKQTREFKSLDGAISAVEEVGFEINVISG